MVVTDFKGEQAGANSPLRTVASSNSGHRQTVPSEAEDDNTHHIHEAPPSYEASFHHEANSPGNARTTATRDDVSAHSVHRTHSRRSSQPSRSSVNKEGYKATDNMNWEEKDATGYWDKYENETGACCSRRGGCVFSDRDGCCFSDREACCFSDRDGCCFSDRGACCFSDNGGCCFADNDACCFSGTLPGGKWKPIPSLGTLFKGLF
ncbi:hypothetical protein PWT90_05100 [Aphanocladium album]|nr:hypothetical protein PWT90_05100 [Aphanocladium album]